MSDHYGSISISQKRGRENSQKKSTGQFRKPPPKNKVPRDHGTTFLVSFLISILAGAYFLGSSYLAPIAIQKYLPGYLQNKTGIVFTMEGVSLNPFNFQLRFDGITATSADGSSETPLLTIPSLFIDLDLTSLLRNGFVCDTLSIEQMELNLIRFADKTYNYPAITGIGNEKKQGDLIDFAKLPFLFSLNNIDIRNSRILLVDQVTQKTHTIRSLQLAISSLSDFSFQSEEYIQPHFSAIINGSEIQLSGKRVLTDDGQHFQTKLLCSVTGLNLQPYSSYIPVTFPFLLEKGGADLELEIIFAPDKEQGERLSLEIKLTGSDIVLQSRSDKSKIVLPMLESDASLQVFSKQLHFKSVIARKAQFLGEKKQLIRALYNILHSQSSIEKGPDIRVDLLLFEQGRVVLAEDSIWNALHLSVKNFSNVKDTGLVQLSGQRAAGSGSFSWQGQLTEEQTMEGEITLNNYPVEPLFSLLHPSFAGTVSGVAELTGDLTLHSLMETRSDFTLENGTFLVHDLKISENKKVWLEATSLRCTRLSRNANGFGLGNVFVEKGILRLDGQQENPLFSFLFADKKGPEIQGLDFSGELFFKPLTEHDALLFTDVRFQANNLHKKNSVDNFVFTGALAPEGLIKARGLLTLVPLTMNSTLAFSGIDSALLTPFYGSYPLLFHSSAMIHGKGQFIFPGSVFKGMLRLSDGRLQREPEQALLSWDSAVFDKLQLRFSPFSFQAEKVQFFTPVMDHEQGDTATFTSFEQGLRNIFEKNRKTGELYPVALERISFQDGMVSLVDTRLHPPWQGVSRELKGYIKNLNTISDTRTSFAVNGLVEGADVVISGSATLFQSARDTRLHVSLTDFPLASFAGQLVESSVNPENSTVSLESSIIEGISQVSSKNEIVIKNLSPFSADTATGLALALLQDSDGQFALSVPLKHKGKSLFQESLDSFRTITIKASYSPLLLDSEFSDLEDNDFIFFKPGISKISPAGKEILMRYTELLSRHPLVGLKIMGMADSVSDQKALLKSREQGEKLRVANKNTILRSAHLQKYQAAIKANPATVRTPYVPLVAAPVSVADDDLFELARQRSLVVYNFCVDSLAISPLRILVAKKYQILNDRSGNGASLSLTALPLNRAIDKD